MLARRFAERHIENSALLDIIELHDDALSQIGNRKGWPFVGTISTSRCQKYVPFLPRGAHS
jgi:hypothetical protein